MKDFIIAALPWIIIGLCLAIIFANREKLKEKNCMPIGMCMGMSSGMAIGAPYGMAGIGSSAGMLVGMTVGMFMKSNR